MLGAQRQGFSGGKALVGGVLLGPVGLLAGLSGKNKIQKVEFIYMTCGQRSDETDVKMATFCETVTENAIKATQDNEQIAKVKAKAERQTPEAKASQAIACDLCQTPVPELANKPPGTVARCPNCQGLIRKP